MHDLLVGNVINYSLVGLPERKAYNCVFDTKLRQDCGVGFHPKKSIAAPKSLVFKTRLGFLLLLLLLLLLLFLI